MRGVIPGEWLVQAETRIGRPMHKVVDLIAGTSTGGILAMLLAAGVSARDAMRFYYDAGPRIFRQGIFRKLYSAGGMLHTKYRADDLERELLECIGPGLLRDALVPVMVTALTDHRAAVMVKSWQPEWEELPMATAAQATSSAQTYFPQARVNGVGYLDGGNVRNNPSVCAMVEAVRLFGITEPILLIHLGTGIAQNRKPLPNGGAAFWAAEIFDATTNGDDSYDDYQCKILEEVLPGFRYERFDVALPEFPGMDDARKGTLDRLVAAARVALLRVVGDGARFEEVCDLLKNVGPHAKDGKDGR